MSGTTIRASSTSAGRRCLQRPEPARHRRPPPLWPGGWRWPTTSSGLVEEAVVESYMAAARRLRDTPARLSQVLALLTPERGGLHALVVRTSRHRELVLENLDIPDDGGLHELVIQLNSGRTVSGRVVGAATGLPVAGAIV
ncbi:MAG: hypothetical protein AB1486_35485 [Planctomycetota bacterium]